MSRLAMSFTTQINQSDSIVTITPKMLHNVGSMKNKIIFKNPNAKIAPTSGKTKIVYILANGVMV